MPTELRGRTEKVGDDLGGESRRRESKGNQLSYVPWIAAQHSTEKNSGVWADESLECLNKLVFSFSKANLKAAFQVHVNVKVIPWYCIAHPYCARFSRHQRAHMSACTCKT